MIFTPAYGGEEFEQEQFGDYWANEPEWTYMAQGCITYTKGTLRMNSSRPSGDAYYGYFNVRANFTIVRGGGPNFPVPSNAAPYMNPVEPVVTEKSRTTARPGGGCRRRCTIRLRQAIP